MKSKWMFVLLTVGVIAGICGAGLSVAMLIRALQWSEWGRVILYCGTTGICVEMAVIAVGKLKEHEKA